MYGYDSASYEQKREGRKWPDIGEVIRRYKLGIMEQERAVRHVADILKRSVYSLSGVQFSRYSQRPKGVLFFAGPAEVGKTEPAKAVTDSVFGSPTNYIRFDEAEKAHPKIMDMFLQILYEQSRSL